jgi:hypothetical protein
MLFVGLTMVDAFLFNGQFVSILLKSPVKSVSQSVHNRQSSVYSESY